MPLPTDRVLDPNFHPRDAEDRALFEAQQNYMYAVFECTMLTDMGKTFVRKFVYCQCPSHLQGYGGVLRGV